MTGAKIKDFTEAAEKENGYFERRTMPRKNYFNKKGVIKSST